MSDLMYRLILKARFQDQTQLQTAIQELETLQIRGATINLNIAQTHRQSAFSFNRVAHSILRTGFMFNMLESAYMRQTVAILMLDHTQQQYNNAVKEYGQYSSKAQELAKRLTLQTRYMRHANIRASVSMGLFLTQIVIQSHIFDKALLQQLAYIGKVIVATVIEWTQVAVLKAKAIALAILSGGVLVPFMIGAGIITAAAVEQLISEPQKRTINIKIPTVKAKNANEALEEQNRRIRFFIRSTTEPQPMAILKYHQERSENR